jgi:hypothetical protein
MDRSRIPEGQAKRDIQTWMDRERFWSGSEVRMSIIVTEEQPRALSPETRQEMNKYGIIRVATESFHYREFRYSNLQDALAQAKRDAENRASEPAPRLHHRPDKQALPEAAG